MVEKKAPKIRTQSDYLSDSKSSEDEVNPHLRTLQEERVYGTIKGSAPVTQVALLHSTTQSNPTVERGPPKQPKIKKLSKEQVSDKTTQTKEKDKPLLYIVTLFSNISLLPILVYICDIIQPNISSVKMNASSWQKAADLIAQGTQANQQVQAAATAHSNQLESLPLSALSADDSGPPQVNYGTEQPLATSTPRTTLTSTPETQTTDTYHQIIPGMSEHLYPTLIADGLLTTSAADNCSTLQEQITSEIDKYLQESAEKHERDDNYFDGWHVATNTSHWQIWGGAAGMHPPNRIHFFHFHIHLCQKVYVSEVSAPPMGQYPPSGKSWICHCIKSATRS